MVNEQRSYLITNKYLLLTILLLALNFICSLSIIYVRHLNRISMGQLHLLATKQDALYQEWTQLLLEQSTLTSYNRVDKIANNNLAMHTPNWDEIKLIVK